MARAGGSQGGRLVLSREDPLRGQLIIDKLTETDSLPVWRLPATKPIIILEGRPYHCRRMPLRARIESME